MTDPLRGCTNCKNARWCRYIHPYQGFYCPRLESIVDNHKPRKEPLASDLIGDGYEGFANRDYKDVLGDLWQDVEKGKKGFRAALKRRIDKMPMRKTTQIDLKIVACLLWFGFPPSIVMRVLRIGKTKFYGMLKRGV